MNKFGFRRKHLANLIVYVLTPIILVSFTLYIVQAEALTGAKAADESQANKEKAGEVAAVQSETNAEAVEETRKSQGRDNGFVQETIKEGKRLAAEVMFKKTGTASYYGRKFHNRTTANGEKFDMYQLSAAHKKLPFGTILRVTNLKGDKTALVRINDRGPYVGRRILDLSYNAAKEIDGLGLPKIKIEGFIANKDLLEKNKEEKQYFGYSFDKELLCLPESAVDFVDSTRRFDSAIEMLKSYEEDEISDDYYLFVPASKKYYPETSKKSVTYYIAKPAEVNFAEK